MNINVLDNRLKVWANTKVDISNKSMIIFIMLINILNILDIITTYIGLHIYGFYELNPFMRMLMNKEFFIPLATIKLFYMFFFTGCFYFAYMYLRKRYTLVPLYIAYFLFLYVVASNIMNLILK